MSDLVRADFRAALRRHFATLFTRHGFIFIAALNEREGEYQMQIAVSPHCQVKFLLEQDSFALRFGRLEAPRRWADDDDAGGTWWHAVQVLMVFEDSIHPDQAASLAPPRGPVSLDGVLQAYAMLLEPYLPRLLAAFALKPPPGWWPAYEAFRATQAGAA